ncbi:MAG: hypothetical protein SGILL_006234 [Bacillariaceae sp.]
MAFEAQFRRDSPPGSVHDSVVEKEGTTYVRHGETNPGASHGREEEGSCEDSNATNKMLRNKTSFSSKHELDAGLESMFDMVGSPENNGKQGVPEEAQDSEDEEMQLVRHLTGPLTKEHLRASERSVQSRSRKKGRKTRGASLERMIAKMILQSSKPGQEDPAPPTTNQDLEGNVSTNDILSDLVKTGETPSALSILPKETMRRVHSTTTHRTSTSHAHVLKQGSTETTELEQLKQEPEQSVQEPVKDEFGFSVDDGWMAFDDCPPFDTSFLPDTLDINGFPVQSKQGTTKELGKSDPVDLDDDFEAEEEEIAAALRKEMAEEIARESSAPRWKKNIVSPFGEDQSALVEGQVDDIEISAEDQDKLRVMEEEMGRQQTELRGRRDGEEARMREEQIQLSGETSESTAEQQEQQDQHSAKELARRIAKEQEWGKLQEMAKELARRQLDEEKHQTFDRRTKRIEARSHPFSLEEVEVAERGEFSDDEVSSLPTTQSLDGKSLSQFQIKEISSPVTIEEDTSDSSALDATASISNETSSIDKESDEPSSPSSVADLDCNLVKSPTNQSCVASGSLAARARYRNTRAVFASRHMESTPGSSRTKPTWNPTPPRHYNRTNNGL